MKAMSKQKAGKDLLLEIGCEELPASYILPALEGMRGQIEDSLKRNTISMGNIKTCGTPRRLILWVEGLSSRQNDINVAGPPIDVAYDARGKPTKALLSFLKARGSALSDIDKLATGKRVSVIKKGISTRKLLPGILRQFIKSIQFPKQMRWENPDVKFPRPIRWILCLYGEEVVNFKLGNLRSGRRTRGHRDLGARLVEVKNVDNYFKVLANRGVIPDPEARKARISSGLARLARNAGASREFDENLLNEVNYLVEHPKVFLGSFNQRYLKLPEEVLIASMSKYQRVFWLRNQAGKLIPKFLGVANTVKGNIRLIRRNYENILEARLRDSLFFYNEDMELSLEKRVEELKGLIFLEGLGSVYEKVARLQRLSQLVTETLGLDEADRKKVRKVLRLAKADLTTHMVGEFPSLQGVMGREYAKAQGLDEAVAVGIYEHYLPRFSSDVLPKTMLGAIASISDKLDTIVGCFARGKQPSASFDPFALRRRAAGIVQIIIANEISISIGDLISRSIECYEEQMKGLSIKAFLRDDLKKFLKERFISVVSQEFRYDIIDAVCQTEPDDIFDSFKRLRDLTDISQDPAAFEKARTVVERTHNILRGARFEVKDVNPGLFVESLEKELWRIYEDSRATIESFIKEKDYAKATMRYGEIFAGPIHNFFDKVLVNTPDERLCRNRMALMKAINRLYTQKVADLAKIVVERKG